MIKGVLLDLSGVIYIGNRLIAGAIDAIDQLRNNDLHIQYITNTTRNTRVSIVKKLAAMNLVIPENQLFTAPIAARSYIKKKKLNPYLLIHPNLIPEFSEFDNNNYDSVLIGDAGLDFTYEKLNKAFRILFEGAPLLAMGDNRYFKEEDGFSLDAGPFVHALELASSTKAIVLGKPSKEFFFEAIKNFHCKPDQVVMVGDDVEADVIGALTSGLQAILVQTGKYRPSDEQVLQGSSAYVVSNISSAAELIISL